MLHQAPSRSELERLMLDAMSVSLAGRDAVDRVLSEGEELLGVFVREELGRASVAFELETGERYPELVTALDEPFELSVVEPPPLFDRWVRWPRELFVEVVKMLMVIGELWDEKVSPEAAGETIFRHFDEAKKHFHPSDGPESPCYFWRQGERIELSLERRLWRWLLCLWPEESLKPREEVTQEDIAAQVYDDPGRTWDAMKADFSRLNKALAVKYQIRVCWEKLRDEEAVVLIHV